MSQKPCVRSGDDRGAKQRRREIRGIATQREQPRDMFQVVIHCVDEQEQERLYDEFRSRNLSVRLLTM